MGKRLKRKLKRNIKKIFSSIYNILQKNIKHIIYSVVFILGIMLISLSFFVKDNWVNICSGVGTGLLTSLVVSVIINAENNAREKRKLEEEKRFLLDELIKICIDSYLDLIYRINEFITLTDVVDKSVYKLYQDFSSYNYFEKKIKEVKIAEVSQEEKKALNKIFDFKAYQVDYLVSELKRLPKHEFFLRGILTQEEYNNLVSNYANDSYFKYANNIQEFWDNDIKDFDTCTKFLRMTTYICAKTISCFSFSVKTVESEEELIKDRMNQLYFDEVYSKSDEYIEEQIRRAEAEEEYYFEHPEELEQMERQLEEISCETPEDRDLKDLYCCICGFSIYSIDEILSKIDPKSEKAIEFIKTEKIQKTLKKKRKLRKVINSKFGKII